MQSVAFHVPAVKESIRNHVENTPYSNVIYITFSIRVVTGLNSQFVFSLVNFLTSYVQHCHLTAGLVLAFFLSIWVSSKYSGFLPNPNNMLIGGLVCGRLASHPGCILFLISDIFIVLP